jgi:hypothetical protein
MQQSKNPSSKITAGIIGGVIIIAIVLSLLSGCYVYTGTYDTAFDNNRHTSELYYWNDNVYFGYHSGLYYYYGVAHYHPWWNY